ncbi:HEPN domain-containing protein [Rhizobium sp. WSM1274]|uniref:HEPN domain-containing protein n=1 Tax=Rhizobium sp. WSM1274 TaxID=3138254 RepID=UPI0021A86F2A|nr:HEPN domain-containing protein [Rhizobium leguminosarum]UWU28867.1 HEPN domain-containing protein [Rhizobium leguminosarum bv. viciae]
MSSIQYAILKSKQRELRVAFPPTMGLRVHRSISWIGRAEKEVDDTDAQFVFFWIAFNAAYADERALAGIAAGERATFADFFARLVHLDNEKCIYGAIWQQFSGPIRLLLANKYVFNPFWQFHNGVEGYADWEKRFAAAQKVVASALASGDTVRILSLLFDRLYVLRNQMVHGGSTWSGKVNRHQVRDGAAILGFLLPVFIDLMMDNPHEDWGVPFYPVVDE